MRAWQARIGILVLSAAFAVAPACSSDPSCEETRTCGSASGGTSGADASDAPAEAGPHCTKAEDCDDGLACNGSESCTSGFCADGTPVVCAPSDPDHCLSECKELGSGQTECNVIARDDDVDLHGDALCQGASNVADDCDDDNPAIYGSATEICDGLDNDCNGKADLFDGLPLGGTEVPIVQSPGEVDEFDIVWSEAAQTFGVVWIDYRDGVLGELYFKRIDSNGNEIGSELRLTNDAAETHNPHIAVNGSEFALLWRHNVPFTPYELHIQRVSASDGSVLGTTSVIPGAGEFGDIVEDGQGAWIAASLTETELFAQHLSAAGVPISSPHVFAQPFAQGLSLSLARASSTLALAFGDFSAGSIGATLVNVQTFMGTTGTSDAPGSGLIAAHPSIAEGAGQFMLAWSRFAYPTSGQAHVAVRKLSPSGFSGCENLSAVSVAGLDAAAVRAVGFDGSDFAVVLLETDLAGTQPGTMKLFYVNPNCTLTSPVLELATGISEWFSTFAALGRHPTGLALLRTDASQPGTVLFRRIPMTRCE